jgi:hypothetical protein
MRSPLELGCSHFADGMARTSSADGKPAVSDTLSLLRKIMNCIACSSIKVNAAS